MGALSPSHEFARSLIDIQKVHSMDEVAPKQISVHPANAQEMPNNTEAARPSKTIAEEDKWSDPVKCTALTLPTENALKGVPNQGWLLSTTVGPSSIPAAGNGRFAAERVAVDSPVVEKQHTPMASIDSLKTVPSDATITFACTS